MPDAMDRVIDRFRDRECMIRRLHHDDQDFRDLCADYGEVLEALDRSTTEANRREFERLKTDLEEEIVARLSASGPT